MGSAWAACQATACATFSDQRAALQPGLGCGSAQTPAHLHQRLVARLQPSNAALQRVGAVLVPGVERAAQLSSERQPRLRAPARLAIPRSTQPPPGGEGQNLLPASLVEMRRPILEAAGVLALHQASLQHDAQRARRVGRRRPLPRQRRQPAQGVCRQGGFVEVVCMAWSGKVATTHHRAPSWEGSTPHHSTAAAAVALPPASRRTPG